MEKKSKKSLVMFILFLLAILVLYLAIIIFKNIKSEPLVAYLIAMLILIWLLIYKHLHSIDLSTITQEGPLSRYTMLCNECGWEWMSHVAEKPPTQCPNCNDKSKLEVVGWRKVKIAKKKTKEDLRRFIHE